MILEYLYFLFFCGLCNGSFVAQTSAGSVMISDNGKAKNITQNSVSQEFFQ